MTSADLGARARLEAAFAREERRGLMLAAAARSAAVLAIIAWTGTFTAGWSTKGLAPRGAHALRGRDTALELWAE